MKGDPTAIEMHIDNVNIQDRNMYSTRLVHPRFAARTPAVWYEIKQIIEEHNVRWTSIEWGQIYFAIDKLPRKGSSKKRCRTIRESAVREARLHHQEKSDGFFPSAT
jgi:DNA-binding PadR family transcriptional regulator